MQQLPKSYQTYGRTSKIIVRFRGGCPLRSGSHHSRILDSFEETTCHSARRKYTIPVEDLLFFLKTKGQKIPTELLAENGSGPLFKSYQNCWQYWNGSEHGLKCHSCIAFNKQLQACFTVKNSGLLRCSDCSICPYYIETYRDRIQFIYQFDLPAAVFKDLHLWGGNSLCAEICSVQQKDLVGAGIEKIVHADSLPKVIETIRKLALGEPAVKEDCSISIKNDRESPREIRASVYPLREPAMAFLVLGVPQNPKTLIMGSLNAVKI